MFSDTLPPTPALLPLQSLPVHPTRCTRTRGVPAPLWAFGLTLLLTLHNPSPGSETPPGPHPPANPGVVVLMQMEIPAPLLRPGGVFHSDHMTVIRFRITPPQANVTVEFTLSEKPDPQKICSPGTRPALLTHATVQTDTAGVARTWLVAGEMEGEVTVKATSPAGAKTKTVQISRSGLSQILDQAPDPPALPPEKPDPSLEEVTAVLALIQRLDAAQGAEHEALYSRLVEKAPTARAALQQAVTDRRLADDTRRLCAKLLLGAREATPQIEFIALLRDDRPAVQEAGLAALERHAVTAIRPLQEQLTRSVDPNDRAMALRMAGLLDEAALAQAVAKALQDDDPLVVSLALQFAAHFLGPELRPEIMRRIFDARPLVAWTALQIIEQTAARRSAIPLSSQAAYDAANPLTVSLETLQAVRGLQGPAGAAFPARALQVLPKLNGLNAMQWQEALVAGRWSDSELALLLTGLGAAPAPPREFLLKLASQPETKRAIREAATLAVVNSTPPSAIQSLLPWFSNDSEEVRQAACLRFQRLTTHDFGQLPEAQSRILEFWRAHGDKAPAEWMIHAIRSKDPMRDAAARELPGLVTAKQLTATRALAALETMVDDAHGPAQESALTAIARLDPEGESTVSRRMAQAALQVLGNPEDFRAPAVLSAFNTMLEPGGYTRRAQQRLQLWEPVLAALLHRSHAVRRAAYGLCVRFSGVDFGFDPTGPLDRLRATQTQYKEWFDRNMK